MTLVLVTGASGFVGAACMKALRSFAGLNIIGLGRRKPLQAKNWVECDLLASLPTEVFARLRPSYLLHTAWYTEPRDYLINPINHAWLTASLDLLDSFAAFGGKRAVFVGTMAEYGLAQGIMSEISTAYKPSSLYACAKCTLREQAQEKARQHGFSFAWARLFHPFGPGEHINRLVPSICSHLLKGRPVTLSSGYNRRDFMPVRETGRALAALLMSPVQGIVNIGTGKGHSVKWIARRIADRLGVQDHLLGFDALLARAGESPCLVADPMRLEREVGYQSIQGIDDGINESLAYWQAHDTLLV